MTAAQGTPTRSQVRLAHLAFAAITIGVVYSPAFDADAARTLLRFVVVPGLALTGLSLWALPKLRRTLAGRGRRGAAGREQAGDGVGR